MNVKDNLNGQPWTRENLETALNTAIGVELFTIPIYLSAASSIITSNSNITVQIPDGNGGHKPMTIDPYNIIMSVAVQEMFHMTMACNLANAMGVRPKIQAPDYNNPPSCLKGIIGMPVNGNLNQLIDTMLAIELPDPKYHYPESPTQDPTQFKGPTLFQEQYDSIGDMYHALAYGVKQFWNYDQANDAYQKNNFQYKYPKVKHVIQSLEDAYNAISVITEQGEGNGSQYGFMPSDYTPASGQQFQSLDLIDHWERFNYIKQYIKENGENAIQQYTVGASITPPAEIDQLKREYTLLINQLNASFSQTSKLDLRGMADTGNLANTIWSKGFMPQWDYIQNPQPWPTPSPYPHSCQGLNNCKNQGYSGNNACAGAGDCATAFDHSCQYTNACNLQGGCGYPGISDQGTAAYNPRQNSCACNGGCQSPISPNQYYNHGPYKGKAVWEVARSLFTESYGKANPGKQLSPSGPATARRLAVKPTSPLKN